MAHHTFQHRAYTSRSGYARISEVLRHNCDLYNAARRERMTAWKQAGKSRTFYDQCKELTKVRPDDPDGYGSEAVSLSRGALKRIDRAYRAFYARCGVVDASHRSGKEYDCSSCGSHLDADSNAAWVILQRGLAAGNTPPVSTRREKSDELGGVNLCQ